MEEQFEFITSWDDGHAEDIKLAKLLLQYKIPAIFYIPTNSELLPDEILSLYQQGFEIGGHSNSHPADFKKLQESRQFAEIMSNKLYLEGILERLGNIEVTSFCYPSGKYDETTIECLKRAGFESARTTSLLNIDKPKDLFRIATTVHVYPDKRRYKEEPWFEVAKRLYKEAKDKKGYFHLWGHSWEIEKFRFWKELDDFFKYIQESKES